MKERIYISSISRDIKNSVKDCLLSLFYRKKDLIDFLYECGSTKSDMLGIEESLTKSQIVDIYYNNLTKRKDSGALQFHSLIRSVLEWNDFNSYWFQKGNLDSDYAKTSIHDLFNDKIVENSIVKEAVTFKSLIAYNNGNNSFTLVSLPNEVQRSCINAILTKDLNGDGVLDIITVGNDNC